MSITRTHDEAINNVKDAINRGNHDSFKRAILKALQANVGDKFIGEAVRLAVTNICILGRKGR